MHDFIANSLYFIQTQEESHEQMKYVKFTVYVDFISIFKSRNIFFDKSLTQKKIKRNIYIKKRREIARKKMNYLPITFVAKQLKIIVYLIWWSIINKLSKNYVNYILINIKLCT